MKSKQKIFLIMVTGLSGLLITACGLSSFNPTAKNLPPAEQPAGPSQPLQGGQQPTTVNQPTQTVQLAPPALSESDVYKAVDAAMAKLITAGPHHVSQTSYEGTTAQDNSEGDIVPPNIHQVMSSKGNVVGEFYVIDGNLYSNNQDGWTQKPGGGQPYVDALNGVPITGAGDVTRAHGKVAGVEMINGKPAIAYNYDSTLKSLNSTSNFTLWVDQASGLPVKQQNGDSKGTKIVQIITYDPGITIALPAEAKAAKIAN